MLRMKHMFCMLAHFFARSLRRRHTHNADDGDDGGWATCEDRSEACALPLRRSGKTMIVLFDLASMLLSNRLHHYIHNNEHAYMPCVAV